MVKHLLFVLVIVSFSTGCSALRGIDRPTVEVVDAQVVDQSALGSRVIVRLKVTNPNDEELPMPRVTCDLDIVGGGRFTFTDVPYATLPARDNEGELAPGEQVLVIPAGLVGGSVAGRAYTVRGTVVFQPEGQIRKVMSDTGIPLPRSAFSGEGTVLDATSTAPAE